MNQRRSIGNIVRKVLGPRLFSIVGEAYRSIFIDIHACAEIIEHQIPQNAHVLDIGGGDGHLMNLILSEREDIHVTMIDTASSIGSGIMQKNLSRVQLLPSTSLRNLREISINQIDFIVISDVIHHIPSQHRFDFIRDIADFPNLNNATLLIKDVEPGSFISWLGYLSDKYISNDKSVKLISQKDVIFLVKDVFDSRANLIENAPNLLLKSAPNYSLTFRISSTSHEN